MSQDRLDSRDQPTRSFLLNAFCRNGENREYLNHDLNDNVRHCPSRSYFRIRIQPPDEALNPHEEIDDHVLTRFDILCHLADISHDGLGRD